MSLNQEEELFVKSFQKQAKTVAKQEVKPKKKRSFPYKPLGYGIFILGLLLGATFLYTMENINAQIGPLVETASGLLEYEESNNMDFISWMPEFNNFYEQRWLIFVAIVSFFTLPGLIMAVIKYTKEMRHP